MSTTQKPINPLFTRQALVALLLPLIAEQALSVTIGLADTLMVSSVGEAAVSGVSLVDTFNTLMIQIMTALATGGAVVASQYIGHQEPKNAKAAAAHKLIAGVLQLFKGIVSIIMTADAVRRITKQHIKFLSGLPFRRPSLFLMPIVYPAIFTEKGRNWNTIVNLALFLHEC